MKKYYKKLRLKSQSETGEKGERHKRNIKEKLNTITKVFLLQDHYNTNNNNYKTDNIYIIKEE